MEHWLFPSVGDGRLFKLHHAHRTPVLRADGVGSVVQNWRIYGSFESKCRHVVVFHVRVAAVQFGLYASDIAGCAHRRPQQKRQHLEMVGAGVGKGAVKDFAPMAGDVPGPVVAGVVVCAAAETVVDGNALGCAEPPGQDILLQSQHVATVVDLVTDGEEPPGFLGGCAHRLGLLGSQAEGLLAQNVQPMRQTEQHHIGVEMHRRDEYRKVGGIVRKKGFETGVDRDTLFPDDGYTVGKMRVDIADGRQVRAVIALGHRLDIQPPIPAGPHKHNAQSLVGHEDSSKHL